MVVITNMLNSKHFQKENSKPLHLYLAVTMGCLAMTCDLWTSNSDEKPEHINILHGQCLFWVDVLHIHT